MSSRRTTPKVRSYVETPASAIAGRPLAATGDEVGAAALCRRVGDSLRHLRKERSWSLDELAEASGVSRAALSQIEGSRTNPTVSLLWKVAAGLGVPFQALLGGDAAGRTQVLRAGDAPALRSTDGRMESRLLSPAGASQGLDVYELRFLPRALHRSEPHAKGTTETVIVLTGALRVAVGDESHDLAPGDSMFFRADAPHSYESRSSHDSRCIDIILYGR